MRRVLPAIVAAVCMTVGLGGSQNAVSERAIRLRLPDGIDLTGLEIRTWLLGPFGGFGDFVRTDPAVRDYRLETWKGGQPANLLKAIVYCPGYRFVLLTESALESRRGGTISIELKLLGSIPLSGEVVLARPVRGLAIEARYSAYWGHEFFGITDGAVPTYTVATSMIAPDGTFTLNVPDFAQDPVVASFAPESRGSLRLDLRDPATGNFPYGPSSLQSIEKRGQPVQVGIASQYPRPLQLVVVQR